MAVLGRLLVSSGERVDLPDFLSVDSYAAGDWQYFMKTLVGTEVPYIIKGFEIIDPQLAIGTQTCSVNIADSAMYYPAASAGSFYYGLPLGDPNAQPLIPELRKNALNYVYLTFTTFNTSQDSRAFWDPDANGGVGSEFTQEVNTETSIAVQVNVSTGAFPEDTVPVAIVTVGPSVITSIQDARHMIFRLGTGGIIPDTNNRYAWHPLPSPTYERLETPGTITSPAGQNPFQGGDKNILSWKEWMDAVMTKLAELGGTQYWYQDASTFSVVSLFHDALATTFKSKGTYVHSSATPGLLTWSEDVQVVSTSDPKFLMLRAGNITVTNEYVAYLPLVRNQPINALDSAVSWTNAQNYINTPNGSIGFFSNLSQGDWVKKVSDGAVRLLRVEQFYDSINLGGSTTTAANAKSVRLNGNYAGSSGNEVARYDKGVYLAADIQIQARSNPAIETTGGDFLWFALRSDTVQGVASASTVSLSGTLDQANGTTARVSVTTHGLVNGDRVTVTAPAAQAGTYSVDVADANTFYISTTNTTTGAFTGFYALFTTAATTNGYGMQLESANHGFESGEKITISGTTNFNAAYVVNYRSATQVQAAIGGSFATETTGFATLSRMDVRTERGITKVVQGETINIGEEDSENIQSYIGMSSLAETSPTYFIPSGYGTLNNGADYNSNANDNLTLRASKLTAMMADKAQDKTVKYLCTASYATNLANGAAQEITFTAASTLTLLQPGSSGNATVTLPSVTPGISLLVNQSAYVTIDRNASSTPSITVANTALVPVGENIFVIASRLGTADVYLWDGLRVIDSVVLVPGDAALVKAKYYNPVSTSLPTGTVIVDTATVNAGELVLFSALSSGTNNAIYMALGTGATITGWSLEKSFNGSASPTSADSVIIQAGTAFKDQIGIFNDTTWVFHDFVRYFNGVDYWEQSNLATSTLADNTTNGTVFSFSYAGSENLIVEFSLSRGSNKETGTIHVATDGSVASVSTTGTDIGASGTTFNGFISAGVFYLRYTTTSTGSSATMKYMIRRWSNTAGGPAGPPSYTGFTGGGSAGGSASSIQFNNAGALDGSANFQINTITNSIVLNGLNQTILSAGITLLDNQITPVTAFTYDKTLYAFATYEYSILRNGIYRTGRLLIANDGTLTADSDDFVETAATGIVFSTVIIGANVEVQYTSTSTGFNATLKHASRRWA